MPWANNTGRRTRLYSQRTGARQLKSEIALRNGSPVIVLVKRVDERRLMICASCYLRRYGFDGEIEIAMIKLKKSSARRLDRHDVGLHAARAQHAFKLGYWAGSNSLVRSKNGVRGPRIRWRRKQHRRKNGKRYRHISNRQR